MLDLYFFKLGIFDGRLGLRFVLMHSIFDTFIAAKVWEKRFLGKGTVPNYYRRELESYLTQHPEQSHYYRELKIG